MANNILYGNFQSLDIITSKEVFEEYQEEIENNFGLAQLWHIVLRHLILVDIWGKTLNLTG